MSNLNKKSLSLGEGESGEKSGDGVSIKSDGLGSGLSAQTNVIFDKLVWMNSADAARYLRMSETAIRNAVNRGHLPFRKWRRRLYFRRTELDRMLESSIR